MESSETLDLAEEYLSEDPDILSDAQLKEIANIFDIPLQKVKTLANGMSKNRKNIDPNEIQPITTTTN